MSDWVEYLLKLLAKVEDAEQAHKDAEQAHEDAEQAQEDAEQAQEDDKGLILKALKQLIGLDEGEHAQLYDTLSELQVHASFEITGS